MLQYLRYQGRLDTRRLRLLRSALEAGPWGWPPKQSALFDYACSIATAGRPNPKPGDVLLLTHHPNAASLWVHGIRRTADTTPVIAVPDLITRAAWERALAAAPRSVDVLWRSLEPAMKCGEAQRLGCVLLGDADPMERVLTDTSFGLSFVLSIVSWALDLPIHEKFAASAAVDALGRLTPVAFVDKKREALRRLAPRVSELLVARDQENGDSAHESANSVRLVPFATTREAVSYVFSDAARMRLLAASKDAQLRARVVAAVEYLREDRTHTYDWTPYASACKVALESWSNLTDDESNLFADMRGIAVRHVNNLCELPRRTEEDLASIANEGDRVSEIAHRVQQAADCAIIDPPTLEQLALGQLPPPSARMPHHFKLMGALGRYYAVTARINDALKLERDAALGFLRRDRAGTGRPLSEWFRLAGCWGAAGEFDCADSTFAEWCANADVDSQSKEHVLLARAKAATLLRHDFERTERDLRALASSALDTSVCWSAHRWLARLLAEAQRSQAATDQIAALSLAAATHDDARPQLALARLDQALRRRDRTNAEAAVASLTVVEPGVMSNLKQTASSEQFADYVARWFPY